MLSSFGGKMKPEDIDKARQKGLVQIIDGEVQLTEKGQHVLKRNDRKRIRAKLGYTRREW